MIRQIFPLLLLFLFISSFSFAQSWERTFLHDTGLAKGFDVVQTADNGYVMVGEVDLPTGAIRHYIWLVKTDHLGSQLWSRVYDGGDVTHQAGRAIIEGANGDLFIAGFNAAKASVLKTNMNGDSLWTKDFGGQGRNAFQDIALDANGNLILVGHYEEEAGTGLHEVWVMGMNTEGDSLWSAKYFDPSSVGTSAMGIRPLTSDNFLVTGSVGGQGFSMEIAGVDGTENWSQTYQFSSGDQLFSGAPYNGASGLLIGGTISGVAGLSPVLFETDAEGAFTNTVDFLSVPFGAITSLTPTMDAGFILTGSSYNFWNQTADMGFITKLDSELEVEWELTFEDSLDKQGAIIRQDAEGSYILAGSRQGGMWLKKIEGSTTSADDLVINYLDIKVYPNPVSDIIRVIIPELLPPNNLSITIYDTLGRLVKKHNIEDRTTLINVQELPRGLYHYTVQNASYQLNSGELILQF